MIKYMLSIFIIVFFIGCGDSNSTSPNYNVYEDGEKLTSSMSITFKYVALVDTSTFEELNNVYSITNVTIKEYTSYTQICVDNRSVGINVCESNYSTPILGNDVVTYDYYLNGEIVGFCSISGGSFICYSDGYSYISVYHN